MEETRYNNTHIYRVIDNCRIVALSFLSTVVAAVPKAKAELLELKYLKTDIVTIRLGL